jgi:hypothetical protein
MSIINLCDLCDHPIKDKGNLLCLISAYAPRGEEDLYSVCDGCYFLIKKILAAKRKNAEQILKDLEKTFKLEPKKKGKK